MKKSVFYILISILFALPATSCKSKKIACPAYGASGTRGAMPKSSKTTSGVLPTDGRGHRTVVPR